MNQATILHGTDGTPDANWQPWLKSKLEARGYLPSILAAWDKDS